jgi:hypothetical protein
MASLYPESSRYHKQNTIVAKRNNRDISALKLRILPTMNKKKYAVQPTDRLDLITQYQYKDATKFWYIADANSELEANNLIDKRLSRNIIEVPKT